MALPQGFEFVVNDQVPRTPGLRWLNAKTVEVHPELYAKLEAIFKDPEQLRQLLGVLSIGLEAFGKMMERAGATLKTMAEALEKLKERLPAVEGEGGSQG